MEMYLVLLEKGGNIISVIHAILRHAANIQRTRVMAGNTGNEQTRQPAAAPCHTHRYPNAHTQEY